MIDDSSIDESDYLDALRDCCPDAAAFAKLKKILDELVARQTHDIAERKQVEAQLRQTTSNLQAIFEAFPDLQFRLDPDGTVLDYHAGSTTELYIPPEQFLGKKLQDILPERVAAQVKAAVTQVMKTKSLVSVEYALPGPKGDLIFEARLLPVSDDRIIAIVRDVTERKHAEAAQHACAPSHP